jgi:hypothetical protein
VSTVQEKIASLSRYLWSLTSKADDYDSIASSDFSSGSAYKKAEAENLKVVLPEPNQLFIDIDNDFAMAVFEKNHKTFLQWYDYEACPDPVIAESKSGGERRHITITLDRPVEPMERLILQAFLGSDLTREFLGLQRIKAGDKNPTLFLEKKN